MASQIFIFFGKHSRYHYKFDTQAEKENAWLQYFRHNDSEGYYAEAEGKELEYVNLARAGSWKAARRIAEVHASYEYEGWTIQSLYGPGDDA